MPVKPAILERLRGVQRAGAGWLAFCPAHNDQHKRSLSVGVTDDGKTLLKCHAAGCTAETITAAVGMSLADLAGTNGEHRPARRREVATYDYVDERGTLLYQVVRFEPKDFRPRRPDGQGGWIWDLKGVRRVVYRLPDLAEQRRVYHVEGEKDADNLWTAGMPATTTPSGSQSWRDDYAEQIRAAGVEEVVVIPDNDGPGRAYACTVGTALARLGVVVRILELPDLEPKGDVSDWLDAGHTPAELLELADRAPGELVSSPTPAEGELLGIGLGQFLAFAESLPPPELYIEGLLSSDGGGWIAGEEKLGKTFYALEESLCLALGLKVCGRFEVPERRRVFFIEEEDPPRRTGRLRVPALLRGHGLDPNDAALRSELDQWFRIEVWGGFTFDVPMMVARLEATIADFQPSVVYVDVLRKVTLRDLNKADQAGALLAVLDGLRRKYNVLFRVLHHFRKVQGFRAGRGSQELGGSFVLGAWAENSLFFEPIGRKQGLVRVEVQCKDGALTPAFRLAFEAEGPRHAPTLVRLRADEDASGDDADEVIFQAVATLPKTEALAGKPGVTLEAVMAAVKRSNRTVRRALKRLEDAGRVLVTGQVAKHKNLYGINEQ
jgi:hypothetical protein